MTGDDSALVDRFLDMLASEAGASRHTLSAYRSDLALASSFLGGALAGAEADAIERLAHDWRDLARATVARKSAALRRFFAFLHEEGHRADDLPPYLVIFLVGHIVGYLVLEFEMGYDVPLWISLTVWPLLTLVLALGLLQPVKARR